MNDKILYVLFVTKWHNVHRCEKENTKKGQLCLAFSHLLHFTAVYGNPDLVYLSDRRTEAVDEQSATVTFRLLFPLDQSLDLDSEPPGNKNRMCCPQSSTSDISRITNILKS